MEPPGSGHPPPAESSDQVTDVAVGEQFAVNWTLWPGVGELGFVAIEHASEAQTRVKLGAVPVIEKLAQLGSLKLIVAACAGVAT